MIPINDQFNTFSKRALSVYRTVKFYNTMCKWSTKNDQFTVFWKGDWEDYDEFVGRQKKRLDIWKNLKK
jgi:hypothetical protein